MSEKELINELEHNPHLKHLSHVTDCRECEAKKEEFKTTIIKLSLRKKETIYG
jgi:hypothetical protein